MYSLCWQVYIDAALPIFWLKYFCINIGDSCDWIHTKYMILTYEIDYLPEFPNRVGYLDMLFSIYTHH
ncbi:hypothetical protein PanWU01x14_265920 [Parasponia andersonii]|uniref:Uncharacterized protein n=1 Tax=Parasponia andersonii TaxID=3476 RepID=A0A2P5B6S2_PARAD|nr:hypothetical protein PanWU01x14_265920 [Parasponia andersonii]